MNNQYHFITRWRVPGTTVEQVYDLISDPLAYPRWWPSVYLAADEIAPGDTQGLGRRIRFHTKGWLPYTLRWESCATESARPSRLAIRATGDFDGHGIWGFEPGARSVEVTFDWKLKAEKPLLRYLSFLLKPVFSANHRWAMARGEESLRLELARRSATSEENRARISSPPGPNTTSGLWLSFGAVILLVLLAALVSLAFR